MKWIACLLALLVASASLAVAQDTTPEPRNDEPPGTEPQDEPQRRDESKTHNDTQERPHKSDESRREASQEPLTTRDETSKDEGGQDLRYISGTPTEFGVREFAIRSVVIGSIELPLEGEWKHDGKRLMLKTTDGKLLLHDNPTGLVTFEGKQATIQFAAGVTYHQDGKTAKIIAGDKSFVMSIQSASFSDGVLTISGGFKLHSDPEPIREHVKDNRGKDVDRDDKPAVKAAFAKAQEKGHMGAQVTLRKAESDVFLYDDVDVTLTIPETTAREGDPIRIQVGANLTEGRTIVIDLDASMLESDKLTLRYFDVFESSSGQINREVSFKKASSLEDVLDPTDDSGPEWWIVEDENGMQLIASIDHWSVHAIEITSEVVPGVILGVVIGVGATLIASVIMLRPRRDD